MKDSREHVPYRVALVSGRPVRWASPAAAIGDYDGRERTLEIFMVDAREQLDVLRTIRAARGELEAAAGGPIIIVFHTVAETKRRHPQMMSAGHLQGTSVEAAGREWAVLIGETMEVQHGSVTLDWTGEAS